MIRINIPKDFYERKTSVSPSELLTMVSELVRKLEELEEGHNYERDCAYEYRQQNEELKKRIHKLESEVLE